MNGTRPSVPPPAADSETAFFWKGLRERRLTLQRCRDCSRLRFPPMPTCPYCASDSTELSALSGRGSVYSYVIARVAFLPEFEPELPYAIGLISLEEGARLPARLEEFAGIAIGDPVEAGFRNHGQWTELRFRRAAPSSARRPQATTTD